MEIFTHTYIFILLYLFICLSQRTILGPLLFTIYINELIKHQDVGNIIAYADDTIIICTGNSWTESLPTANALLNKIAKSLASNK